MRVSYDWNAFHEFFSLRQSKSPHLNIFVLENNGIILDLFLAPGKVVESGKNEPSDLNAVDWEDWLGAPISEIVRFEREMDHQRFGRVFLVKKSDWEKMLVEVLDEPHLFAQEALFRDRLPIYEASSGHPIDSRTRKRIIQTHDEHFILKAIQGWWSRILPSAFGIYIRMTKKNSNKEILLIVRRGEIDEFHVPEYDSLSPERRDDPQHVIRYLSEKYLLPVQGLFIDEEHWTKLSSQRMPWKELSSLVRKRSAKMVPFRTGVALLVGTRAHLGV